MCAAGQANALTAPPRAAEGDVPGEQRFDVGERCDCRQCCEDAGQISIVLRKIFEPTLFFAMVYHSANGVITVIIFSLILIYRDYAITK
jgi:hypothetical protein